MTEEFFGPETMEAPAVGAVASLAAGLGVPSLIKAVVNRFLRRNPSLRGRVEGMSWNPFTGRLTAHRVSLVAFREDMPIASLHADVATVTVSLREAIRGRLVADVALDRASALWRADAPPAPSARSGSAPFYAVDLSRAVRALPPFRLQRLTVRAGELHVQNLPGQGGLDVRLDDIEIAAENIVTRSELAADTTARVRLSARVMDSGRLMANAVGDPMAPLPLVTAEARLEGFSLPEIAPLLRGAAGAEVKAGVLSVYAEAATASGAVRGYVKPFVERLSFARGPRGSRVRTALARAAAWLAADRARGRIATRVPFDGPFEKPVVRLPVAIRGLLRNAFLRPIEAGLDGGITAERVAREVRRGELLAPRRPSRFRSVLNLIAKTAVSWSSDGGARMGASLSYYTVFSLAPLILLAISIAGLVFGEAAAEGRIIRQLSGVMGAPLASTIQGMVEAARRPTTGIAATIIGLVTLLIGASAVMSELKTSLNRIWRAKPIEGIVDTLRRQLLNYSAVLAVGFLLLVSLLASAAISAAAKWVGGIWTIPAIGLQGINLTVSIAIITVLFAMLYRVLPDAEVEWKDVWVGSLFTTGLFVIGKQALGIYLGRAASTSAYGAAGSVLILLAWVYYSAQIFYLGAEFTRVYSELFGSRAGEGPAGQFSGR